MNCTNFSLTFFQEKHKKITDEIYNFQKLHKLHTNIENEIIREEINKSNQ